MGKSPRVHAAREVQYKWAKEGKPKDPVPHPAVIAPFVATLVAHRQCRRTQSPWMRCVGIASSKLQHCTRGARITARTPKTNSATVTCDYNNCGPGTLVNRGLVFPVLGSRFAFHLAVLVVRPVIPSGCGTFHPESRGLGGKQRNKKSKRGRVRGRDEGGRGERRAFRVSQRGKSLGKEGWA